MLLQLLLSTPPRRGFLRLPVLDSRGGFLEVGYRPGKCPLVSVVLFNGGGEVAVEVVEVEMVVVVVAAAFVSLQRAKEGSSSHACFSCVQATLGVVENKDTC